MKYLLYCIFGSRTRAAGMVMPSPTVGRPVQVVEEDQLTAAFSVISNAGVAYEVSELKRYHGIVEWLFGQTTVIPFRFGTVLDARADVELLLKRRADQYKTMLSELEGCAEMGIRTIVDEDEIPSAEGYCQGFPSMESLSPGKLYLLTRRVHYSAETLVTEITERATERYRNCFAGMFKKCKCEISSMPLDNNRRRTVMISIYFLVPRDLLTRFRQTFRDIETTDTAKLMLTGPWPPYNFVLPSDPPEE